MRAYVGEGADAEAAFCMWLGEADDDEVFPRKTSQRFYHSSEVKN